MSERKKERKRERERERERERGRWEDGPSGKPLFFSIPDAVEVSRFFRPYRTFRFFDFDVGAAGGFRETRCGSILLAAAGQRLRVPGGCSSFEKENAPPKLRVKR